MLDKYLLKGDILEALLRSPPGIEDLRVMLAAAFPADLAEILEDLEPYQQLMVLRCLSPEIAATAIAPPVAMPAVMRMAVSVNTS